MEIKKNEIYEVEIIDNGCNGEGIAKIDGFTVFVPNVIKGEKVEIKILKVLSSHAFAKVEKINSISEFRKEADCDTFSKCGGCSMRHMEYVKTLEIKRNVVESSLRKQGISVNVNPVIGMVNPYFYRNKLQYPVGINEQGEPVIGVFAQRSHRIIETKKCMIQNRLLQNIANDIFEFIKNNDISVYDAQVAIDYIKEAAGNDIDTIFGVAMNDQLGENIIVTVIATGFDLPKPESIPSDGPAAEKSPVINSAPVSGVVASSDDDDISFGGESSDDDDNIIPSFFTRN